MADTVTSAFAAADIETLASVFRGEIIERSNPVYDAARVVWNGMIDRRPALILRPRNTADVVSAVNFARSHRLAVAIRSGGHNVAGYAVCDGGLMIDMTLMNGVRLAPSLDTAFVEGGAHWLDVDAATAPFNRAAPGGLISATGVAGLTLSGGIGWLRGRHGLACDNLIGADVVTADGRFVHCSETENADLLWGLRGGGGNFGAVTSFEFRLHEIPSELMFCAPIYAEERAQEIIPRWRDFMATAPERLSGLAEFSTIPEDPAYPQECWGRRVLALAHVYDGAADEGERVIAPMRAFGDTLLDFSGRMPYRTIQTLYDAIFPKGRDRCYWKSCYLKSLDEGVVRDVTQCLSRRPSDMTYASIWKFGGAMQRVAPDGTAFGDRSAPFMLSLDAIWSDATDDDANISWVRKTWEHMQRHSTGKLYLNFPGLGEDPSLVKNALGDTVFTRLQQLKRKYDPDNFFRLNQNVPPA